MLKTVRSCLLSALLTHLFFGNIAVAKENLSDDKVKQAIIDESIAAYPGTCACPSIGI